MAMELQTMVFSKSESPSDVNDGGGWTKSAARDWLKSNGFNFGAYAETQGSHRFRQFDPNRCASGSYRTLTQGFPVGLFAIACQTSKEMQMEKRDLGQVQKAWARFELKDINEDQRIIEGIASTPSTDRAGDIVEPMGAKFALPMPFLYQHNSREPIGQVITAKPTKAGIPVTVKLPFVSEPGALKDRVDQAWQEMKYGLIKGLSIGFMPKVFEPLDAKDPWGPQRFKEWDWMELSAVTIPANADASITAIKSADLNSRAASGADTDEGERKSKPPGASGPVKLLKEGTTMTYKEQIKALEATRAAKSARMTEIQKKVSEEGRTKDQSEREEFDTLGQEIGSIDAELKDLRELEKLAIHTADPVDDGVTSAGKGVSSDRPAFGSAARVSINAKLEPGIKFARMALCVARAKKLQMEGMYRSPDVLYRGQKAWMESAPDVELALKAAVNADDSTTSTAASEWAYAQNIASEFIEYLRPMTILGRIQGWRRVPFNVRIGGMDGGATGYWVGQGIGITNSKPTSTSVSLGITKVAGMCVITKELAMLSTPSAEMMVRNDLARALQQQADTSLIDPNSGGVTNVTPASLTYGATARQASGTDYAAFKADWKAMTTNFYAANISLGGAVVIMKEELAEALSLMVTSLGNPQFPGMTPTGGMLLGREVIVTQAADTSGSPDWDNMLILLQPNEVFLADDGVATVEASDQVSVEMTDDNSAQKSTATAAGASLVSMFQTESIAIKGVRHVNWAKARSQACQFIRSAAYV